MDKRVLDALKLWGIEDFYPPQRDSLELIVSGKNIVACVPTAAGKSIIAYMAVLNRVFKKKKKALYIVPLRALATEKYDELRQLGRMGLTVALSYGDYDDDDSRLERYDIVIATSEKADSLLRHRTRWLRDLSVIVADEVHLLDDSKRGPTLEVILTRFKQLNTRAQMVCLSATVKNAEEIASWLDADLIKSDFRPVSLKEGVLFDDTITFGDGSSRTIGITTGDPVKDAVLDVIEDSGGQALVFVNTRRSAESAAEQMAKVLAPKLVEQEARSLRGLSDSMGNGNTRIEKRLKRSILGGVSFHHAGLSNEHRRAVEAAFKKRKLKALFATPTLAAGINLPARRVIVRDWTRFEQFNPRAPIPVLEIKQMFGRAGRPGYDTEGESLVLARNEDEVALLTERYLWGEPEEVFSKLGSMPALRTHLLSSFATNYVRDMNEMWDFIRSTFFSHQNDTWRISAEIERVMEFLEEEGFLKRNGDEVEATDMGKRVARLYIDPLSAVVLKRALSGRPKRFTPFSILQAVSYTPDIPSLFVRGKDYDLVVEKMYEREDELMLEIPQDSADYDLFLASVKTALLFMEWIGENDAGVEASEERLEKLFNVGPGDVRNKVETAIWLLYSMRELSRLVGSDMANGIDIVTMRMEHGIKKELIPLVKLKNIGRVRARSLFEAGIRGPDDIRKATISRLAGVRGIGRHLASALKGEVSGEAEDILEDDEEGSKQTLLMDFR